jgi:predicted DNA-binding protein with PD1-like motif
MSTIENAPKLSRHASITMRIPAVSSAKSSIEDASRAATLVEELAQKEMLNHLTIFGFGVLAIGMLTYTISMRKSGNGRSKKDQNIFTKSFSSGICTHPVLHALRIRSNEEIKSTLTKYVEANNIRAGAIVSCVGSTAVCTMRLADAKAGTDGSFLETKKPSEILSLSGTVSVKGSHLHISLGDDKGHVCGGHLITGVVNTTCEIVICDMSNDIQFEREMDSTTGYKELVVKG